MTVTEKVAPAPEYVSVKTAEIMTGRSHWSWRREAYVGKIASVKFKNQLLIPITEIRRRMAENTRPAVRSGLLRTRALSASRGASRDVSTGAASPARLNANLPTLPAEAPNK